MSNPKHKTERESYFILDEAHYISVDKIPIQDLGDYVLNSNSMIIIETMSISEFNKIYNTNI